jgi:hypothetical protein
MDARVPQVICRRAEQRMNAAFNAVSDALCIMRIINAADAIRHRHFPKDTAMLILLIALAVALSLLAEMAWECMQDRYAMDWVRAEVREHQVITRKLGKARGTKPRI